MTPEQSTQVVESLDQLQHIGGQLLANQIGFFVVIIFVLFLLRDA